MYYICYKTRGSDEPWQEKTAGRSRKQSRSELRAMADQKNLDGSPAFDLKLCVGKGRDRRDIVRL